VRTSRQDLLRVQSVACCECADAWRARLERDDGTGRETKGQLRAEGQVTVEHVQAAVVQQAVALLVEGAGEDLDHALL